MRTETITTTINGYSVELDLYEESGEQRSDCTVRAHGGQLFDSLETIEHTGEITDAVDRPYPMQRATIDAIRAWADANGY